MNLAIEWTESEWTITEDDMKTQHTPGPWDIARVVIESRGGSNTCWKIGPMVACIYDDWRPRELGISELANSANARLIAAAPELLAACIAVYEDPHTTCACAEKVRAAIAKATSDKA